MQGDSCVLQRRCIFVLKAVGAGVTGGSEGADL